MALKAERGHLRIGEGDAGRIAGAIQVGADGSTSAKCIDSLIMLLCESTLQSSVDTQNRQLIDR